MQCREFSIMADLSDKYYTVFKYSKKIFHRPKYNGSWKIDKLQPYRVFLYAKWSILIANINKFLIQKYFKRQKQPFADDLKTDTLKRFCNIHRKTPVLESLFNDVASLKVHNFVRKRLHQICFLVKNIAKFFRTAFKEHLFWKWVTLNSSIFLFKCLWTFQMFYSEKFNPVW